MKPYLIGYSISTTVVSNYTTVSHHPPPPPPNQLELLDPIHTLDLLDSLVLTYCVAKSSTFTQEKPQMVRCRSTGRNIAGPRATIRPPGVTFHARVTLVRAAFLPRYSVPPFLILFRGYGQVLLSHSLSRNSPDVARLPERDPTRPGGGEGGGGSDTVSLVTLFCPFFLRYVLISLSGSLSSL